MKTQALKGMRDLLPAEQTPVSYTHLDVYKRQLLHKRLNFVLTHLCQSFTQLSHRTLFCLPDKTKETVPRSCRVLPLSLIHLSIAIHTDTS